MEKYDFDLNDPRQKETRKALNQSYGFGAFDDDISIMKKFIQSKHRQMPMKVYAAPEVPLNFNLRHKLEKKSRFDDKVGSSVNSVNKENDDEMSSYIKSVSKRSEILGEEAIKPESVLDIVSAEDREFLRNQALKSKTNASQPTTPLLETKASVQKRLLESEKEQEKKTKRYESYVSFVKKEYKGIEI